MNPQVTETELILEGHASQISKNLVEVELEDYFEVLQELGSGAYGSVLMAQNRTTDQKVALKLLSKGRTSQRRFLMEYCIAFCLSSHPNIIASYGVAFQTKEHYVFAQELAPRGDLFSLIQDQVGIPEEKVKRCAVQISSALDFMRSKGLVHRDIKPENVLLYDKECHSIKVTDFGLTRLKGTVVSARSGTVPYMSPEVYKPHADCLEVDFSLDVWAFGILLFCVLTGTFPWEIPRFEDINYSIFVDWATTGAGGVPCRWKRFTVEALNMFHKFLAHKPLQRSNAVEVLRFIDFPWTVDLGLAGGLEDTNNVAEGSSTELTSSDSMSSGSDGQAVVTSSGSSSSFNSESIDAEESNKSISLGTIISDFSDSTCSSLEPEVFFTDFEMKPDQWVEHSTDLTLHTDYSSLFLGAEVEVS
ncbi:serine/threonine-protein kinase SBK1-like [Lissotriton helveticus]